MAGWYTPRWISKISLTNLGLPSRSTTRIFPGCGSQCSHPNLKSMELNMFKARSMTSLFLKPFCLSFVSSVNLHPSTTKSVVRIRLVVNCHFTFLSWLAVKSGKARYQSIDELIHSILHVKAILPTGQWSVRLGMVQIQKNWLFAQRFELHVRSRSRGESDRQHLQSQGE